uniref:Uncharacterized protein n=1 Tax=Meloidogyne javanica TaxID=6303 RepID=A0A915LUY0_MELJA
MQSGRRKALLSLLNIITEDLQIEEVTSIAEAKILIPILIKFNNSGDLRFIANDVDFRSAVDFIRDEMGDSFVECLDPDLADKGDQHAIECFLLALIYVLRIKHDEKFLGLCTRLDENDNIQIAWMIEKLDSFGHFSVIPFHELLPSPLNDKENTSPAGFSTPLRTVSDVNISRSWKTLPVERRRPCLSNLEESPVNKVLGSPRGEDVSRIYALRQEVKRLREFAISLGREKDQLDDLYSLQSKELNEVKGENERLQGCISRLLPQSERVAFLEDKVLQLDSENAQFSKSLIAEKNRNAKNEATMGEIMFQRDEALQKVDLLVDQLKHLQNEYEKALRRGNDELQMHEQSRKLLLASEKKWSSEFSALQAKLSEAYSSLEQDRKFKLENDELKEYERDEYIFSLNQNLERAEEAKRKMEVSLVERDEKIKHLNDLAGKRAKQVAELQTYHDLYIKLKREVSEYKRASEACVLNKNNYGLVTNYDEPNKIECLLREQNYQYNMQNSTTTVNDFIVDDCFADDDLVTSDADINTVATEFRQQLFAQQKSFLERDNFENELGPSGVNEDPFGENFTDMASNEIIDVFGEGDFAARPVVVFYAYRLPSNKAFDHLKFLRFVQFTLDKIVDQDYTVIYFHYGLRSNNKPPFKWLFNVYQLLDRRYKKNLKALYLVHPTKFIRFVWRIFQPIISFKFEKKLHYVNSLNELTDFVSTTNLNLPQPIIDIMDHNPNCDIPPIASDLMDFLLEHGLQTKGIFRRSANVTTLKALQQRINLGEKIDFLRDPEFNGDLENSILLASVLLKTFLRSLGEPLITNKLYPELTLLAAAIEKPAYIDATRDLLQRLPPENLLLLKRIIEFLKQIEAHSEENLMNANNLSVVFGPNLTWPTDQQVKDF